MASSEANFGVGVLWSSWPPPNFSHMSLRNAPNKDSSKDTYCTSLHSQTSSYPLHYKVTQAIGRPHGLEVAWRGLSQQIILGSLHCVITQPRRSVFRPVDCRAKIGQGWGRLSLQWVEGFDIGSARLKCFVVKGSLVPVNFAVVSPYPVTPCLTGQIPILLGQPLGPPLRVVHSHV